MTNCPSGYNVLYFRVRNTPIAHYCRHPPPSPNYEKAWERKTNRKYCKNRARMCSCIIRIHTRKNVFYFPNRIMYITCSSAGKDNRPNKHTIYSSIREWNQYRSKNEGGSNRHICVYVYKTKWYRMSHRRACALCVKYVCIYIRVCIYDSHGRHSSKICPLRLLFVCFSSVSVHRRAYVLASTAHVHDTTTVNKNIIRYTRV